MNGINAPKVVECLGSDGRRYRQLAKSGNDDLRQDAVRALTHFLTSRWLCLCPLALNYCIHACAILNPWLV